METMSEFKTIKVRLKDESIEECSVEIVNDPDWELIFSGLGVNGRKFSGRDLFDSLIALRLFLEGISAKPLCAGARRDVFPSGMSRDMGGGRKAYITRLGTPVVGADLLDIFDYANAESVGTVAEQQDFHDKWIEALRSRRK